MNDSYPIGTNNITSKQIRMIELGNIYPRGIMCNLSEWLGLKMESLYLLELTSIRFKQEIIQKHERCDSEIIRLKRF